MQAVLFPVPVLLQGTGLDLSQQGSCHVGVLVNGLLPLCELRQARDGAHEVACAGLHELIRVCSRVHVGARPPVQICHCLLQEQGQSTDISA